MSSGDNLLETITTMLEQFIAKNQQTGGPAFPASPFDSKDPPPITLRNYVARLDKYLRCSNECYLIALIFIDRMIQARPREFRISSLNVHRALLSSLVVAAKMRDDVYYANKYYAQVGGVDVKELNYLEGCLLTCLDWNIYVSHDDYCHFLDELRTRYGEFTGETGKLLERWEKTPAARAYKAEQRRMAGGSSGESSSESLAEEEEEAQPDEVCMRRCPLSMDSVHNLSSIGNSTGDSGDDAEMCDDSGSASFGSYQHYQHQQEQWPNGTQYNAHVHGVYYPDACRYEQGWGYGGYTHPVRGYQGFGY